MKAPAVAEAAVDLAWLAPSAGSLAALVRWPAAESWQAVRGDPGALLLWARSGPGNSSQPSFDPVTWQARALLDSALHLLDKPAFVDWAEPNLQPVYRACLLQAALARGLAERLSSCDPDCAWSAAFLAPLGWLAVAAVQPNSVAMCRDHPEFAENPAGVQAQLWGLDHTAIARRLCRRWKVQNWLAAIIGQLGLPAAIAGRLGADPILLQVVQLAVATIEEQGSGLGLVTGDRPAELGAALGLTSNALESVHEEALRLAAQAFPLLHWDAPAGNLLLRDLINLARQQRAGADDGLLNRLQAEIDQLHHALEAQCAGERERLEEFKLQALAEFAAGAGHEINNPLAVISGQAQYLVGGEADESRSRALQTIIGQTRRIHHILTDLMHFARPTAPQKQLLEISSIVHESVEAVHSHAEQHQVQIICPELPSISGQLYADPHHVRSILTALLTNAIEAAPPEGWVSLRVQPAGAHGIEFLVEDNGPGPTAAARAHMFDPFFSGRSAGRGRGLGLSTAWRLAQLAGGHVRFDDSVIGLTRFILHLPFLPLAAAA